MDQSSKVKQQVIESIKGLGLQEDQVDIRIHYAEIYDSYSVAIKVDPDWKGYINQVANQATIDLTIDIEDEHLKGFNATVRASQLKDGRTIFNR